MITATPRKLAGSGHTPTHSYPANCNPCERRKGKKEAPGVAPAPKVRVSLEPVEVNVSAKERLEEQLP